MLYGAEFTSFTSILVVGYAFVGGIGFLFGPIFGSTLAPGSLGTQLSNVIFSSITQYMTLIGGAILILLVLQNQDGIAKESVNQMRFLGSKLSPMVPRRKAKAPAAMALPPESRERVAPMTLEATGLTVRYGGVTAVRDLDLTVVAGKITGLIGPNGAGKTSVIDAVTGFTRTSSGIVMLNGTEITTMSVAKRSRAGVSRSFQSLELFEDSTVLDNLRAAYDPRDRLSYLTDLVWPKAPPMPGAVVAAVKEFGLQDDLLREVQDLSYGQRRLLAIARAVATQPGVLLLDEPAAGLGDAQTAELANLVRRLADDWGIGVLLVEHDMNFVMSVCDHIVVLDFGLKIAEGSPEEIRSNPAVIAAYLGQDDEALAEVAIAAAEEEAMPRVGS